MSAMRSMSTRTLAIAVALCAGLQGRVVLAKEATAALQPQPLASFGRGTFLENLDVAPNGDLFFTSYVEKSVYRWQPKGGARVFAKLPVHAASVRVWGRGLLIAGHGKCFTEGPGFTSSNQFAWTDSAGKVTPTVPAHLLKIPLPRP